MEIEEINENKNNLSIITTQERSEQYIVIPIIININTFIKNEDKIK